MKTPSIPIAKEGVPFIFLSTVSGLVSALLGYDIVALSCLALTAFITYFFRDPSRIIPDGSELMISPADGKIILAEEIHDDRFLNAKVRKISIFMNIFNVHVNRTPLQGTVQKIHFQPGEFYSADKSKAALHNEHCALTINSGDKVDYAVVQVAGLIARRIVCWAEKGDSLKTGQRFGLIRFGSRVDLYLPACFQVEVAVGQKVRAGESIIAKIIPQ